MLERFLNNESAVVGTQKGLKAAAIVTPIMAAIQALRGKPLTAPVLTGIGVGALTGLGAAAINKYQQSQQQQQLQQNPYLEPQFPAFTQGFENVRNQNQASY